MNSKEGALGFDAFIDDTSFKRTIRSMRDDIASLTKTSEKETSKISDTFKSLGRAAVAAFSVQQFGQFAAQIVKVRGEFQQLDIAFTTMLGSKAKSDRLLNEMVNLAGRTPFGLKDLAGATKMLLAYGSEAESVTGELETLGDIASGVAAPINDLVYLYGTLRSQGRAFTVDIRQFASRGIPIYEELSKVLKVNREDLTDMIETGKVGFKDVEQAFKNMTGAGGLFFNLMDAQSKSIPGQIERLKDALDRMYNEIGIANQGIIEGSIQGLATLVENYETIAKILGVLVVSYGAYRAALMLTVAAQSASLVVTEVTAFFQLATAIRSAADAQALFNITALKNPYAIGAAALVAVVSALYLFRDTTTQAEKAQQNINEAIAKGSEELSNQKGKILTLTATIKDETISRNERNKSLQELIALSPSTLKAITLENIATTESVKAIQSYIDAKKRQIELQANEKELNASIERQAEARRNGVETSFGTNLALSAAASEGGLDYAKAKAKEAKRLTEEVIKSEDALQAKIINRVVSLKKAGDTAVTEAGKTSKALAKTVGDYDAEIEALNKKLKGASSKAEHQQIEKQIAALEKQKAAITGGKTSKKAKTDADTESSIRLKSFAEELEEKRRMYELYDKWVQAYGKQSADTAFKDFIKQGQTYKAYVDAEIARLEDIRDVGYSGKATSTDIFDLDKLYSERDALAGNKSTIDLFRTQLDAARNSAATLTDELEALAKIRATLTVGDGSMLTAEKTALLMEREIEVNDRRKELLRDFLVSVAGSEEKRLDIVNRYADLRAALEARHGKDRGKAYEVALDRINTDEANALKEFSVEAVKASKGYKELERAGRNLKANDTAAILENERAILATLPMYTEEYRNQLEKVEKAEKDHRRASIEGWTAIAGIIGDLGESMEGLGGTLGNVGGALSGLANAAGKVGSAFANMDSYTNSDGKLNMQGYAAAAQNVLQIITGIIEATKKRREAEKKFEADRLGFSADYQVLQNQAIGKNYKTNPFYTDYDGMIKAGVEQYNDALDKYQAALDKLDQGAAKERQKNVVDGKTTLGAVGAGAAAGAIIGSVLPGVGTAIGAVVGGVVGLVGGLLSKKKKDVYGGLLEQYPELIKVGVNGVEELDVALAKSLIARDQVDAKTKIMLENAIALNEELNNATKQIQDTMVELTGQVGNNLKDALVDAFKAGESGASALHKTVSDIIADVTSKLLFSNLVGPALDQLTKEMTESLTKGDGSIVDDLTRFEKYGLPNVDAYMQALAGIEDWAKQNGFEDIFGRATGKTGAMEGRIAGASEETISVLIGQFNAVRIYQARMANDMAVSVNLLGVIAMNTSYNSNLALLPAVVDRLETLNNTSIRGFGL